MIKTLSNEKVFNLVFIGYTYHRLCQVQAKIAVRELCASISNTSLDLGHVSTLLHFDHFRARAPMSTPLFLVGFVMRMTNFPFNFREDVLWDQLKLLQLWSSLKRLLQFA